MATFSPVYNLLKSEDLPTEDLPINEIVSRGIEENLYKIFVNINNEQ